MLHEMTEEGQEGKGKRRNTIFQMLPWTIVPVTDAVFSSTSTARHVKRDPFSGISMIHTLIFIIGYQSTKFQEQGK